MTTPGFYWHDSAIEGLCLVLGPGRTTSVWLEWRILWEGYGAKSYNNNRYCECFICCCYNDSCRAADVSQIQVQCEMLVYLYFWKHSFVLPSDYIICMCLYIDGLVLERCNFSALAIELCLFGNNSSIPNTHDFTTSLKGSTVYNKFHFIWDIFAGTGYVWNFSVDVVL